MIRYSAQFTSFSAKSTSLTSHGNAGFLEKSKIDMNSMTDREEVYKARVQLVNEEMANNKYSSYHNFDSEDKYR